MYGVEWGKSRKFHKKHSNHEYFIDPQPISNTTHLWVAFVYCLVYGYFTNDFPSDGLVIVYDDIAYGLSLGMTSKFPRYGLAFKWRDGATCS